MRLKRVWLLAFIALISLCSCSTNSNNDSNNISLYTINGDISIANANQYLSIEPLDIPAEIDGYKVSCSEVYNESNLIVFLYRENPDFKKEIGMYNLENQDYTCLLELENQEFEIKAVNEKYMILIMSENAQWRTTSLHCYDFENKSLVKFFDHSIDPDTQSIFYQNYNNILIQEDKVYFDDYCQDEDNNPIAVLYSYDLNKKTVELFSRHLQNPLIYNNEIIAFAKNDQGEYKSLRSITSNYEYLEIKEEILDIALSEDNIFCLVNDHTNLKKEGYIEYEIKNLTTDQVILSTRFAIDSLDCRNDLLTWRNFNEEYYCVYDLHTKQLLIFYDIPRGANDFRLKGNDLTSIK